MTAVAALTHSRRARPFLKWAGGKTQLLPEILARFPERYGRYVEPFLGGGAVFFALAPHRALLSDVNLGLIEAYGCLRDNLGCVVDALAKHEATREQYYKVRSQQPELLRPAARAARMIFLNRTCFNGLYRVNRRGVFNVPYGRHDNPRILDIERLEAVSAALAHAELRHASVFELQSAIRADDLVYMDPPYDPVSATASFTSYTCHGFGHGEQGRLAELFQSLAARRAHVLLSNSDTPLIRRLYHGHTIEQVFARRAISRSGAGRGPVAELLISPRVTRRGPRAPL
jgi:DNA adenine methylase